MFSSARLAVRRAASLGAGLCRAAEDPFSRRLLHGQLLPRSFASDAFGHSRVSVYLIPTLSIDFFLDLLG